MRLQPWGTLIALSLCVACTATDAAGPAASSASSPGAGTGCSANPAATATCEFIATVQTEGPDGLFNQEFAAAQEGEVLPEGSWVVERCDDGDRAVAACQVTFESSSGATFSLVATNAEDGDGRLVLLEGQAPVYEVQSYVLS